MGMPSFYQKVGFEPIAVQHAGGMLLTPVQKLVATLIFAHTGKNANRIPNSPPKRKVHHSVGFSFLDRDSNNQMQRGRALPATA